jgi:hypothetical protein
MREKKIPKVNFIENEVKQKERERKKRVKSLVVVVV